MDSCFHFDFVKAYGESLKDVTVIFPEDDPDSIIIDGSRQRGYCGYVSESGMSSDGLYHRVHLSDYTFWVDPSDYDTLMNLLEERQQQSQIQTAERRVKREEYNRRHAEQFVAGVQSDEITEDIYRCFLHGSPIPKYQKQFAKVTELIGKKCTENGGRLYKSAAKGANYAIEADYNKYTADHFDDLRQRGYKVITLEQAVQYMHLEKYWAIDEIQADINEQARYLGERYLNNPATDVTSMVEESTQQPTVSPQPIQPVTHTPAVSQTKAGNTSAKLLKVLAPILCVMAAILMLASPIAGAVFYLIGVYLSTVPATYQTQQNHTAPIPIFKRKGVIIALVVGVLWLILCRSI